jgi:hypothetical protein
MATKRLPRPRDPIALAKLIGVSVLASRSMRWTMARKMKQSFVFELGARWRAEEGRQTDS